MFKKKHNNTYYGDVNLINEKSEPKAKEPTKHENIGTDILVREFSILLDFF